MKKLLLLFTASLMITSCNSQTDLEILKCNESILEIIKNTKEIEKDHDIIYGLKSYRTDNLQNFRFGNVSFSKYVMPNAFNADYNDLYLHVDNYENNNFIGFTIELVNKEEGEKLFLYLKQKYGNPEFRQPREGYKYQKGEGNYIWDSNNLDYWILLSQTPRLKKDHSNFIYSRCVLIKKGTRVENSTDSTVFTVLDSFKMSN